MLIGHPCLNQQHLQWAIFTFSWYFDLSWHGCANSICIPSDHLTKHTFTSSLSSPSSHLLIDWLLYLSFADGNAAKVKAERPPGSQRSTGTFLWLGEAGSLSDKDLCRAFVLPNWPKCTQRLGYMHTTTCNSNCICANAYYLWTPHYPPIQIPVHLI